MSLLKQIKCQVITTIFCFALCRYFPNSDENPKPLASPIKWKAGKNLVPTENPAKDTKKRGRDLSTFFHWLTSHHQFNEDEISEVSLKIIFTSFSPYLKSIHFN